MSGWIKSWYWIFEFRWTFKHIFFKDPSVQNVLSLVEWNLTKVTKISKNQIVTPKLQPWPLADIIISTQILKIDFRLVNHQAQIFWSDSEIVQFKAWQLSWLLDFNLELSFYNFWIGGMVIILRSNLIYYKPYFRF